MKPNRGTRTRPGLHGVVLLSSSSSLSLSCFSYRSRTVSVFMGITTKPPSSRLSAVLFVFLRFPYANPVPL
uniref:Putative secreted protein n=1 Tax=Anopheles triannulatus TaxID=58253 RepID=A0A2M4B8E2_9DIPT